MEKGTEHKVTSIRKIAESQRISHGERRVAAAKKRLEDLQGHDAVREDRHS
jgi:hypothetical protein